MQRATLLWILAVVLANGSRGLEEWDVRPQGEVRAPTGMPSPLYFPARVSRKVDVDRGALLYREEEYPFAMVADLDLKSRHPQRFEWTSYLRKGRLVRVTRGERHASHFVVRWDETLPLNTHTATKNRSMELSELVQFNGLLLGFCDITGIAFKIVHEGPTKGNTYVRHAIADGDGDFPKAMKAEWATVKDGSLWVGSPGLEWRLPTGKILHRNPEWVKTISVDGRIENINWRPVYQALRSFTNTSAPGYLWHEAVHWDPLGRRWIFLPRKASTRIPYTPADDERQGSNVLIVSSEHFQHMRAVEVGPLEPEWGFTAVRKLPGSEGTFMALKVREVGDETSTKLCVFDLQGRFLTDPPFIPVDGNIKYEGLEFPTPKVLSRAP